MSGLSNFINSFNLVRQVPIFNSLNLIEQQRIARKVIVKEYKKGEIICRQNTKPDYFYCLISGRLQSYREISDSEKDNIDFIHRGMHFGIISILTGENHSLSFEAINDSVVLQIPKEDFDNILKAIPRLGIELSQSLSQRIRRKHTGSKTIFESNIISIYSPVKGTGSSTYAANLAYHLHRETKKNVVFVSILSKAEAAEVVSADLHEATPKWTCSPQDIGEVVGDHDKILHCVHKNEDNVDLIYVTFDENDPTAKKQISPFVSALVGDYHYVVVDLPNEMDEIALETLTQSDLVHLLTPDKREDLQLIRRVIDRLEVALKENFREERIKVIIRAVHAKVYLSFEEINRFLDYFVYNSLPQIHREQLTEEVNLSDLVFKRADDRADYSAVVKRIAREIGGVLVGVVLGGGAALGVAHIGVIRVLEEENIPVDIVVGSSMGALIAAMWTVGNDSKGLEKIAREFEKKSMMLRLLDLYGLVNPISGVVGGSAIKRWLKKHLGNKTFYGAKIPLKIVAYDLIRREEIVINGGSLVDAVRESIAIPGVIKPVLKDEKMIIDGGVLNPLPTNVLAGLGIKKIIAINVLQSPEDAAEGYEIFKHEERKIAEIPFYKSPLTYIHYRLGKLLSKPFRVNIADIIVRTLQATEYVIAEQSAQQADVVIHPDLVGINWFELDKVDELIQAGQNATKELLPEIKKLVEE